MGARLVAGLLRSRLGGEGVPRRSIESPSGNRGWGGSGTKEHFPRRSISIDPRKAAIARHAASTPPPIRGLSPAIHALALLLLLAGSTSSPANGTCINLFNGNTLDGWTPLGPARFEAVDGVIRGTPVDSEANSFLATNEEFGDFELHLQFRFEAGMFNSGVQFRSNRYEHETPIRFRSGDKRMIEATAQPGRVYGYQAEIDPSPRAWSAEIYDEAARGWLEAPDKPAISNPIEPGSWQRLKIRAEGPRIRTWLNGLAVADLHDDERATGFIALQVHGVYEPEQVGKAIEFRGLELCPR